MTLRFGILLSMDYDATRPVEEAASRIAQVELAREVGLDGIWLGEHRIAAPLAYFQSIPLAARLAAVSGELDLGVTVVAAYANPLVLAEDLATLDILTGGHARVCLAQGWRETERRAFGVSADAFDRYLDTLELLPRLWTSAPVAFTGRAHHVEDVRLATVPIQRPGIPQWLGASSVAGARRAGRRGAVWLASTQQPVQALRNQADAYDASLSAGCVVPARPVLRNLIIDDGGPAARAAMTGAREYYRTFGSWGLWERAGIAELSEQERLDSVVIRGDVDQCARRVVELARLLRRDYFFMKVHWSGIDDAAVLNSIRLLGTELAPRAKALFASR